MRSISVELEHPLQLPFAGLDIGLSSGRVLQLLQGHGGYLWRWSRRMEMSAGGLLMLLALALGESVKLSWSREGTLGMGWSLC